MGGVVRQFYEDEKKIVLFDNGKNPYNFKAITLSDSISVGDTLKVGNYYTYDSDSETYDTTWVWTWYGDSSSLPGEYANTVKIKLIYSSTRDFTFGVYFPYYNKKKQLVVNLLLGNCAVSKCGGLTDGSIQTVYIPLTSLQISSLKSSYNQYSCSSMGICYYNSMTSRTSGGVDYRTYNMYPLDIYHVSFIIE